MKTYQIRSLLLSVATAVLLAASPNATLAALKAGDVLLAGSQWLGGQGVDIYYNGHVSTRVWGYNYVNGIYVGLKWQCVEMPQRLYTILGWYSGAFYLNACDVYPNAASLGMTAYPNGSGYVPVPGDMVVWAENSNGSGPGGHIAVVDYVDTGHVFVCEQNGNISGRAICNRSGVNGSFLMRSDGWGTISGCVHSPKNNLPGNPPPNSVILDNSDSGFSASTNWVTGTSATDKYGADYRFRGTAATSDEATWTANLSNSGTYNVYAWWSQGSNRSTTAPYIVYHSAGSTTVNKNQQSGGGSWQSLGAFSLNAGSNNVKLSCWTTTGFVVIADAVQWMQQ